MIFYNNMIFKLNEIIIDFDVFLIIVLNICDCQYEIINNLIIVNDIDFCDYINNNFDYIDNSCIIIISYDYHQMII